MYFEIFIIKTNNLLVELNDLILPYQNRGLLQEEVA